jgi:hypothetical protein
MPVDLEIVLQNIRYEQEQSMGIKLMVATVGKPTLAAENTNLVFLLHVSY